MTRHILLVSAKAAPGQDDNFNAWYDEIHLPDVIAVDGFKAARRFRAEPAVHGELPPLPYLAIYEIETDDLPVALESLSRAAKGMHIHSSFDRSSQQVYAFTEISAIEKTT